MPWCHPLRRPRSPAAAAAVAATVLGVLAPAPPAGAVASTDSESGTTVSSVTTSGAHPFSLPGVQTQVRAGDSPDGVEHHIAVGSRRPATATAASAHINVTYHGFSPQAQAAFQAAVDVWQHTITSSVPINVDATWEPLPLGVLGQAGPTDVFCDVPGGLDANTCYPV